MKTHAVRSTPNVFFFLSAEMGLALIGIAGLGKVLLVMVISALGVRVTSTSGDQSEGELQGFTKAGVSIEVDGDVVEFGYDSILSVERLEKDEDAVPPTKQVTLLSGSVVHVTGMSLKDEVFKLEPRRQAPISLPVKAVKSARFRASNPATDAQWLGIVADEGRRDSLAIIREGDEIDPASVVIESIKDEKISFMLGEDTGAAPMTRLEGIVFGGKEKVRETTAVQVKDVYGSKWAVESITPSEGDELTMVLSDSLTHKIQFKQIDSIRWTSGLLLLASQEPAKQSYSPYIKTNVSEQKLAKWFGPAVEKQTDLAMAGGSSIEYRIEGDYSMLAGSVTRSKRVSKGSEVIVSIELDGKEVWKEPMLASDTRGFNLKTGSAKRVRFLVDSGDDGDVGDTVIISRPRLLK